MKLLPRNSLRTDPQNEIFTRPQTAKLYSYKKLTQILQGKYMSIQNKIPPCLIPKSSQDKKRQTHTQTQSRMMKKSSTRNPSIDNLNSNNKNKNKDKDKERGDRDSLFGCFQFQRLKKEECKTQVKIGAKENQSMFVPYAKQQQNYVAVSEPSIPLKTMSRNQVKKRTENKEKDNKDSKENKEEKETLETIQSWKSAEQDAMHFSSLFKKSWRF